MLDKELTIEEKKIILDELLSFSVNDDGVIYDDEGYEFYGYDKNNIYSLDTLRGIIKYIRRTEYSDGVKEGESNIRCGIKRILNI